MPYDPNTMTQVDDSQLEAQLAFVERSNSRAMDSIGTTFYNPVDFSNTIDQNMNDQSAVSARLRCAIFGIPVVVGCMIALGVLSARAGTSVDVVDPSKENLQLLPNPPANLADICTFNQKDNSDGGVDSLRTAIDNCREACEVADCCDFPSNLGLSCLAGNEHKCLNYHEFCRLLQDNITTSDGAVADTAMNDNNNSTTPASIPVAPINLLGICAASSIAETGGFEECQQACSSAKCCYDKSTPKCEFSECSAYAPCLTLSATKHVHPDIPSHVEAQCRASSIITVPGRTACRNACSHALCCFSGKGCPHKDSSAEFCKQYESCNSLEKSLTVKATATEISDSCTNLPFHENLCEVVCERGQCCFLPDGCADIFPDLECSAYESCEAVLGTGEPGKGRPSSEEEGYEVEPFDKEPAGEVGEATNKEEPSLSNGREEDNEIEMVGEGPSGEAGETENEGDASLSDEAKEAIEIKMIDEEPDGEVEEIENEEGYTRSSQAEETEIEIIDEEPGGDLGETNSKLQDYIFAACEDDNDVSLCSTLCESGECCLESNNCLDSLPADVNCDDYIACPASSSVTTESTTEIGDKYTWADIKAACSGSAVTSMCSTMCKPAKCCFPSQQCEISVGFDCEKYEHCSIVF